MRAAALSAVPFVLLAASAPAASTGGTAVPNTESGGVVYGQAVYKPPPPSVKRFAVHGRTVLLRIERGRERGARVVLHLRRGRTTRTLSRHVRTRTRVRLRLPELPPGNWSLRLKVRGTKKVARAALVVHGKHHAHPVTPPPPVVTPGGAFPVAGPHSYGDGIGAARKGHTHQGQDILAAGGTPVVAPLAGTVLYVDYQAHGAGYYVVENAADGRAFFFAHCQRDSVAVLAGSAVRAGQQLCRVGRSGDASGPHLHFEIWVGGWRVDAGSHFIDPLPDLRSWDR